MPGPLSNLMECAMDMATPELCSCCIATPAGVSDGFSVQPDFQVLAWSPADLHVQHPVHSADLVVLLGDDVRLLSRGWADQIEAQFREVAARTGLPFGVGCVCFRDRSFEVFPTFPVIHRSHFDVFGRLLPPDFVNQHGDPFLFELYRR